MNTDKLTSMHTRTGKVDGDGGAAAFSQSARLRAKAALSDAEVQDALRALGVSDAEVDVCRDREELMELFDAVTSMEAIGREQQQHQSFSPSSSAPLPEL